METRYGSGDLARYAGEIDVEYSTLRGYKAVSAAFPAEIVDRLTHPWTVYQVLARQRDRVELVGGEPMSTAQARELRVSRRPGRGGSVATAVNSAGQGGDGTMPQDGVPPAEPGSSSSTPAAPAQPAAQERQCRHRYTLACRACHAIHPNADLVPAEALYDEVERLREESAQLRDGRDQLAARVAELEAQVAGLGEQAGEAAREPVEENGSPDFSDLSWAMGP